MADELQSITIPPPVGGWNTRDPISTMGQEYALSLTNYFPTNGTVDLRNGQTVQTTLTNKGYTMGSFVYGTFNTMIVNDDSGKVWSVSPGSSPGTLISGAITEVFNYYQQFKDRVFITSDFGLANVYHWTGTGDIALSGFVGPGGDDKLLGPMHSYKGRLYFAARNAYSAGVPRNGALSIWYAALGAVTGALTEFPLNTVFRLGGSYISFIGSVTRAKDFSEDNLFVIVSSEGEILLYQGDSPEATNWSLLGTYFIPKPLSPKAFFYFGSNLVIITRQGVFGMDAIMAGGFGGNAGNSILNNALDDIIRGVLIDLVIAADTSIIGYDDLIWTGIYYPKGNYLLINVPITDSTASQLVMNTNTGAWCLFQNQNAFSWIVFDDRLFYCNAAFRQIMQADDGYIDADPLGSTGRVAYLRTAYNYLGNRALYKQFIYATPIMYESQGLNSSLSADVDFQTSSASPQVTTNSTDTSYRMYQTPVDLDGSRLGKAISINMYDDHFTTKRRSIQAFDILYKEAGIIGATPT